MKTREEADLGYVTKQLTAVFDRIEAFSPAKASASVQPIPGGRGFSRFNYYAYRCNQHWPIIVALGVFWASIAALLTVSLSQNQGQFVYTLDDPYIHMAMAKNFSQYGVWGITRYGFTSSTSSLLWTLLLSLVYALFGVNEAIPFILNVIFGTATVSLGYIVLRKQGLRPFFVFALLLLVIFFAPLPSIIFSGQEHTMQVLVTILFVYLSAGILSKGKASSWHEGALVLLAPVVVMTRYEGLFLVLVVSVLFALRRRLAFSLFLCALGGLPILIYGMISVSHGWSLLPNSVLLKGRTPNISSLESITFWSVSGIREMMNNPHILALVIISLIIFIFQYNKEEGIWKHSKIMPIIFITTTLLHVQFARLGWLYRYEAYLVALGIVVIGISLKDYLPRRLSVEVQASLAPKYAATAFVILLIASPFFQRAIFSLGRTPQAARNIYEQQYQMGLFLREFYQGEAVAANDIGAISFIADIRTMDLWGLGNLEVGRAKRDGKYNTQKIHDLTESEGVKIAIVYDHWFEWDGIGGLPSQWTKVAEWKIPNYFVTGGDTVSFYALNSSQVENLTENLKAFSPRLPGDILQTQVRAK